MISIWNQSRSDNDSIIKYHSFFRQIPHFLADSLEPFWQKECGLSICNCTWYLHSFQYLNPFEHNLLRGNYKICSLISKYTFKLIFISIPFQMCRSRMDLRYRRRQRAFKPNSPLAKPTAWDENKSGKAIHNKYLQTGESNIME